MSRASKGHSSEPTPLSRHLQLHRSVAKRSLQALAKSPGSSLMTVLVISVALLLPALLFTLNSNLTSILDGFQSQTQLTAYLKKSVSESQGQELSDDLLTYQAIDSTVFISAAQALDEFSTVSSFAQLLDELDSNPLPAAIVITPSDIGLLSIEALLESLEALNSVDFVQLDNLWLQRLSAISELLKVIARVLSMIVLLGLFFIVGNTIKLAIENRRNEIRVIKLIGGTNLFIARPFLYSGLFYGLGGGILASILQLVVLMALNESLQELMLLYDSDFQLQGFNIPVLLSVILCGGFSTWLAALLVSLQNIRAIDP